MSELSLLFVLSDRDKQDGNYKSCYLYSSLFVQHNNTVKKLEGQSNKQGTSWLLRYII